MPPKKDKINIRPPRKTKGRDVLGSLLATFSIIGMSVVARRSIGIKTDRDMHNLRQEKAVLKSQAVHYQTDIYLNTSREKLLALARNKFHLRTPTDTEVIFLDIR